METESVNAERPDEATVLESVQRVEARVLAGIRVHRRHRRGLTIGASILAGLALFGGGVAVGAAALRPDGNSDPRSGISQNDRVGVLAGQFVIDCYSSTSADASVIQWNETIENGPAPSGGVLFNEQNPTAACDSMRSGAQVNSAACGAARNWVKVYPRGMRSAKAVCASVGLRVWLGNR
jgi:hypothetical protein